MPFWLFTLSLMLVLTLPSLVQDGMFTDAVLYTSVSRNLANGLGTFWFPYFDPCNIIGISSFHEQPPLAFGIQALFFKIFGDHFFVERLYTFFTMCLTALLITILWKEIYKKKPEYKPMAWLPVLLWITIPVCFWSYSNNMHENTMGIFILLSVIVMYKSLKSEKFLLLNWLLAGLLICMAALSKGFPGFFSLGLPFLYWAIARDISFKKMALQTTVLLSTILLAGLILYFYPPSRESLSIYLFKRAFARINDAHTVDSRFFILFRLFSELIPQICFTALFFLISRIKKIQFLLREYDRTVILFFALGFCGSLPLMLTKVQNGFYFVPSLPYFGIAFAAMNISVIDQLIDRIKKNIVLVNSLSVAGLVLLAGTVFFSFTKTGHTVRDKEMLHDVHLIGKTFPAYSAFGCSESVYTDWAFGCYLVRYYNISLNGGDTGRYYLAVKNEPLSLSYPVKKMQLPLEKFDSYQKE